MYCIAGQRGSGLGGQYKATARGVVQHLSILDDPPAALSRSRLSRSGATALLPRGPTAPLTTHPHPVQPRNRSDALLRQPVGRLIGGNLFLLRDLEDAQQSLVDLPRFLFGSLNRPPVQLAIHIDDTATVDDVIRSVKNPALLQQVPMAVFCQLVIGASGDDLNLEPGQCFVIYGGAEGARRVDISFLVVDGFW